jgi:Holliday junction resolvasome RuvABC ATP-dependent DNA helicase subunit
MLKKAAARLVRNGSSTRRNQVVGLVSTFSSSQNISGSHNTSNSSRSGSSSSSSGNSSSGNNSGRWSSTTAACALVSAAGFAWAVTRPSQCDDETGGKKAPLSAADVTKELRERLTKIRESLGPNYPVLTFSHHGTQQTLGIQLSARRDLYGLLQRWAEILGNESASPSTSLNPQRLEFSSKDQRKRILVHHNDDRTTSVWIVLEDGLSLADLEKIAQGYAASCAGAPSAGSDRGTSTRDRGGKNWGGLPFDFSFHLGDEALDRGEPFGPSDVDPEARGGRWQSPLGRADNTPPQSASPADAALAKLRTLGVEVFDPSANPDLGWDCLAGYDRAKADIEETVVNALKYPKVYDQIAKNTRVAFESNRPKALLLDGPPGTGKTLTARILASRCGRPLIHLKLEDFVSKWYGESEKKLASIFDACDALEGTIIFIDEIDAVAGSRDNSSMHEATRRILSVVLQRIEGFKGKGKSLLICATNRRSDLDAALLSRFDLSIRFELPDLETRKKVFARYARQFVGSDRSQQSALATLAGATAGLSCRDIKEVCEHAERQLASKLIAEHDLAKATDAAGKEVPTLETYLRCISYRKGGEQRGNGGMANDDWQA